MLGTALTGGAVPVGTPAIAASAGGAVVTGLDVDRPSARNHARAHGRHHSRRRDKQRQSERERQRQRQNLLRDVTLALTPMQKGETDSRALPYNRQQAETTANSSSEQNSLSDITNLPAQKSDAPAIGDTSHSPQKSDPPVTSSAPQGDAAGAQMLAYLRDLAAKKQFTGSALVVRRGQVLARFAAGEADENKHIPNRPDTVYRVMSITKQFTSMLMLKLQYRGLLKLDDRICPYLVPAYITACPTAWRPITIRETLTHTSGIPNIETLPSYLANVTRPTTPRKLIQQFVNLPLDFTPGTSWKYTNSGYVLAGAIIQAVTHKPYGTVLRDEITGPLHLEHTGYSRGYPPAGYAKGYFTLGSPAPLLNGSELFSATGLYSTVDDLARWDRAFGSYKVAPPATVKLAFTPQAKCPPAGCLNLPSSAYAFGWLVDRLHGHRLRYHPGLFMGYTASNMYLPDDDIQVVVLSNVQNTDTAGIARHLATFALDL
ncbi:serine hydrolase domain-containing protein [Microbispora catharanthi]|uniref:Serine hydrolase n=1 Tax=Microbispora catharanthi TaxID=1712871 RepID=A0A5N6BAU8_9ACTN|nr:serine hydrolase domain-containing protein [Microbispora catharanthi]KAB8177724.1 serine hydrolase [Microbispora catharanthi]